MHKILHTWGAKIHGGHHAGKNEKTFAFGVTGTAYSGKGARRAAGYHRGRWLPVYYACAFCLCAGKYLLHGLTLGEKLRNIAANRLVGFEVENIISLIHDEENPCDTNTEYESVIIRGYASMIEDLNTKASVLDALSKNTLLSI